VTNVGKTYGKFTALENINLEVADGEFLAVMGPSGSGKSTLINVLGLLDQSYTGEYLLEDKNYKDVNDNELSQIRGDQLGFVFQNFKLLTTYNVYENIEIPLVYSKKKQNKKHEMVEDVIKKVGLTGKEKNRPSELSGGQQQRLCIARSIAMRPDILLLDEPASALDPISTSKIEETLHVLSKDYTIIIVTHNLQQASRISDYTAFLHLGHIIEYNKTAKIFTHPKIRATEDYVSGNFG
ncbi:ATP-binding cassette domain-containing protein, partial [Clostridium botulinum]|uniref:phosphate ABC transporter ATP-binding protein n=1 Tax=Clostridium botulinum TaxID=1491 RepID=UPI00217E5A93